MTGESQQVIAGFGAVSARFWLYLGPIPASIDPDGDTKALRRHRHGGGLKGRRPKKNGGAVGKTVVLEGQAEDELIELAVCVLVVIDGEGIAPRFQPLEYGDGAPALNTGLDPGLDPGLPASFLASPGRQFFLLSRAVLLPKPGRAESDPPPVFSLRWVGRNPSFLRLVTVLVLVLDTKSSIWARNVVHV